MRGTIKKKIVADKFLAKEAISLPILSSKRLYHLVINHYPPCLFYAKSDLKKKSVASLS